MPRNYWSKADVYVRTAANPQGKETNITASVTGSDFWDAKDLDVSPDGTLLIFALRGPIMPNQQDFKPPTWHIWQYAVGQRHADCSSPAPTPTPIRTPMTSDRTTSATAASCFRRRARPRRARY